MLQMGTSASCPWSMTAYGVSSTPTYETSAIISPHGAQRMCLAAILALTSAFANMGCSATDSLKAQKMIVTVWFEPFPQCEQLPPEGQLVVSSKEECQQYALWFEGLTRKCDPTAAAAVIRFEFFDAKGQRASWFVLYGFDEIVDCSTGESYAAPSDVKTKICSLFKEHAKENWCEALGLDTGYGYEGYGDMGDMGDMGSTLDS